MSENTNLIAAIKTPVVLTGNFEEVRAHFVEQLKAYDLVVTVDTLPDAKKLATELNKAATEVKSRGKAVSSEALAPINAFDAQVKELAQLLLDARAKLTEQIKRFEDETRAKALVALQAYLVEQGTAKNIQPEFQRAQVADLANLSTLTSTGKLSAKAKAEVDARIQADLNLQTQTEMRLLKLENESFKAGLAAALERRHVEPFLFADEAEYSMRLASLLEAEVQREAKARQAADERAAREAKMKAEAEQRAAQAEADRKEAERIRAEQQAKHEAEMAAMKAQQEKELAEQKAQMQRAPQPVAAPISLDNAFNSAPISKDDQTELYAIGDVRFPKQSAKHTCTFAEACAIAASIEAERVAIWTKAGGALPVALLVKSAAIMRQHLGAA
jgi:hypothetical protein